MNIQLELSPEITELLRSIDNKLSLLIYDDIDKVYTVKEAALKLGISETKVREYINSGDIPAINIGAKNAKNASYRMTSAHLQTFREKRKI